MLAGPARPLVPAAKCFVLTPASEARRRIFMRQAVLSLLLACEPEEWFFASGGYVRFLHSRSLQKTFVEAMVLLFVCAVPGWRRAVAGAAVSLALSWLRLWRQ